jgi:hypothetical protein
MPPPSSEEGAVGRLFFSGRCARRVSRSAVLLLERGCATLLIGSAVKSQSYSMRTVLGGAKLGA